MGLLLVLFLWSAYGGIRRVDIRCGGELSTAVLTTKKVFRMEFKGRDCADCEEQHRSYSDFALYGLQVCGKAQGRFQCEADYPAHEFPYRFEIYCKDQSRAVFDVDAEGRAHLKCYLEGQLIGENFAENCRFH